MEQRNVRRNDGELTAAAAWPGAAEFSPPPREFLPPASGASDAPCREIAAPPPEFPRELTTQPPQEKKRRRVWQKLVLAALASVVGFSLLEGSLTASGGDGGSKAPEQEAAQPPGEEQRTEQTEPPAPEQTEDAPTIEIGYALTDGETIFYSYYVQVPNFDLPEEAQQYWPVTVHPTAENDAGQVIYGETDVWEFSRASQFAYEIPVSGTVTGELTLKLNAEYEMDGALRTVQATAPIEQMPAAEAFAYLYVQDDGTADFKAAFTTTEDDTHVYELEPLMLWAEAFNEDQQRIGGFWTLEDLSELDYESFGDSGNREYVLHRWDKIGEWPDEAAYCSFRCYVRDNTNGYIYQLESNVARLPRKSHPLGDEIIELTVYNDTLDGSYENLVLVHTQINAADFTEYELPIPTFAANYSFTGYVGFFGSPFDNGYDAYDDYGGPASEPPQLTEDFSGEAPVEFYLSRDMFSFPLNGLTLTKAMVEYVPVAADGVRYVNIHATWQYTGSSPEFYVELDDGQGNVTNYPVAHPLASEGFFFTETFPQPVPPMGYFFDGWYDENGNRVEVLMDYFSFTPYLYDENGKYVDYDWGSPPKTVHLVARWTSYT